MWAINNKFGEHGVCERMYMYMYCIYNILNSLWSLTVDLRSLLLGDSYISDESVGDGAVCQKGVREAVVTQTPMGQLHAQAKILRIIEIWCNFCLYD